MCHGEAYSSAAHVIAGCNERIATGNWEPDLSRWLDLSGDRRKPLLPAPELRLVQGPLPSHRAHARFRRGSASEGASRALTLTVMAGHCARPSMNASAVEILSPFVLMAPASTSGSGW